MKYEKIAEYSNTKFRRITGVKRATFDKMVEILQKGYAEKHRRRGRTPKLSIEDLLLATLEYLREYRTYAHIAASYGRQTRHIVIDVEGKRVRFTVGKKQKHLTVGDAVILYLLPDTPVYEQDGVSRVYSWLALECLPFAEKD